MEAKLIFNGNSYNLTPNRPQEEALLSIAKMKQQNKNKYLVVLPSGIGKTYLSAFETYDFDGKILYLVHRNEILDQAKEVFKKIHNIDDKDIGVYNQNKKELNKKLVFATVQTLSREKNLKKINKDYFDYIILDEWHHVGALSYKRVLNYLKPRFLLGMTATPYRLDGKDILSHIDFNVPYQMELKEGIESGLLVPFIYYGLWDDIDYSDIKWNGHKYTEKDLNRKLLINKRDNAVIKEVKEKIGDKQCIAFCCSVKHVKRCIRNFNNANFSTVGIHWGIKLEERRKIIKDFRDGKYQIIFTRDIFNEGVDFPEVEGLLFLRPTFSKTVFFQQLGRGLRTREGKENVIVLDFIGNYANAYKIQEWLKEVISTGERGTHFKPEYSYKRPEVYFDKAVIDIFASQEPVSDEKIIEDFYELKKELGRIPKLEEFRWGRGGQVYRRWNSWYQFLIFIGEKPTRYPKNKSLKEIKIEYFRLKRLLRQTQPLTKKQFCDLRKRRIAKFGVSGISSIYSITYNEFLFKIGEQPRRWDFLDEKILKELYKKIKKEKNRVPLFKEMPFSLSVLQKLGYKSWSAFVKSMGDRPYHGDMDIPKQELIDDVRRVWDKLGKQPSDKQYREKGIFSSSTICTRFGLSWEEFMIKIMGGHSIKARKAFESMIPQNELEKEYVRVRNILGHPVVEDDFEISKYSRGGYLRVWGRLSVAQRYLEKKYFDNYFRPTKQDCVNVYIEARKKLGNPVPISRIKKISYSMYEKKFGTITKAKEECEKEYIKWKKESDKT